MDSKLSIRRFRAAANNALAKWPAGRAAIGRTEINWASVSADGNPLGSIFLPETL